MVLRYALLLLFVSYSSLCVSNNVVVQNNLEHTLLLEVGDKIALCSSSNAVMMTNEGTSCTPTFSLLLDGHDVTITFHPVFLYLQRVKQLDVDNLQQSDQGITVDIQKVRTNNCEGESIQLHFPFPTVVHEELLACSLLIDGERKQLPYCFSLSELTSSCSLVVPLRDGGELVLDLPNEIFTFGHQKYTVKLTGKRVENLGRRENILDVKSY